MSSHVHSPQPLAPVGGNGTLPSAYGVTRLVLMPRDPLWLHSYWEIAPYTWSEVERAFGPAVRSGRPVLRFFPEGRDAGGFDVEVSIDARNWYVRIERTGGSWYAQLGLIIPDGRFVLLAVSNAVRMPAGRVSDVIDDKWAILRAEWERLFALSGAGRLGAGSLDMARMMAQRWELFKSVSSWSGTLLGGGSSWSRAPESPKSFWLTADAELVVYGATEPDARVTLQGQPVKLNPDGTFSFRFALPDGEQRFPISAVDKDGDLSRSLEIVVRRTTSRPS